METWHDGLPSELPEVLALPERPRVRLRRQSLIEADKAGTRSAERAAYWRPAEIAEQTLR